MLNNVKVSPLTKISERDLWEALEDVATTLSRSSDELEREIHDIISVSRYGNQDADTFFQIAADVCCYAYEEAYDRRIDLNRDDKARNAMLDTMINFAVAVFSLEDRDLSQMLSDRSYDEFKSIEKEYNGILRSLGGNRGGSRGGVSSGRRPVSGRDMGMRDEIDDRRSMYRGSRSVRDDRDAIRPAPAARRPTGRVETREPEPTRPTGRSPRYANREPLQHTAHTTPAPAPTPEPAPVVESPRLYNPKANKNMENYEAHELRGLHSNSDLKIIPMVDFSSIPPLSEKYEENNEYGVKELTETYCVYSGNILPINPEIAFKTAGARVLTYRGDQYTSALLPVELASVFEPALNENIGSFDRWWAVLSSANAEIARLSASDSPKVPQCIAFVRFINHHLTELINDMMCVLFGTNVTLRSFVDNYDSATETNTCRNYLYSDECVDELRMFNELQTELLRHNFAFVPKIKVEEQDLKYVVEDTEEYNQVWFRKRNIIVTFKDTILGDSLVITDHEPVKIERDYAEAFYDVCSDIVAKRTNGLSMATIYLTDLYGNVIKLVAGKHRGGIMVAKLIEGWK